MADEVASTLERFEEAFDLVHQDANAGKGNPFVSIGQVVHRLNVVLGLGNWSHSVLRDGVWPESDEVWVYGRLEGWADGEHFVREDYGSKKITRSRDDKTICTQLGDDYQGAKSDSLKRCAKQLGVAAYLSEEMGNTIALVSLDQSTGELLLCSAPLCGKPIIPAKVGRTVWSPLEIARRSKTLTGGKLLCAKDYFRVREEKQAQAAGATGIRRGAA